MEEIKTIYTVGHSNIEIYDFIEILKKRSITCIADVRSAPYSKYVPQFNKENLKQKLMANGIAYSFLGKELGARQNRPELFDNLNRLVYTKYQETNQFQAGVERLKEGIQKGFKIALMCSEADPFNCHRFVMISSYLVKNGFVVRHILNEATVIDNSELEKKLLEKYNKKLPKPNLFDSNITLEKQLVEAYRLANEKIAFKNEDDGGELD